jgi:type I restriction enzyme R subunit
LKEASEGKPNVQIDLEHAIRHDIRVKLEENPVYYTSLREKLEKLIEARKQKQMDIVELVEQLRIMVKDMRDIATKSQELGLTREHFLLIRCWRKSSLVRMTKKQ